MKLKRVRSSYRESEEKDDASKHLLAFDQDILGEEKKFIQTFFANNDIAIRAPYLHARVVPSN